MSCMATIGGRRFRCLSTAALGPSGKKKKALLAGCSSLPRTPRSAAECIQCARPRSYGPAPLCGRTGLDVPKPGQNQVVLRGPRTYLALSGGGADGAYGAGVLNGWTEARTRPSFSMVSGVSTGALIAPFAFLGSDYDATLRDVYTSGVAASLLDAPNPFNAIFGSGLFGNTRLRELVAKYIDETFVAAVAAEHAKGRMLFVVTTNLDSQRTAMWDMGRIDFAAYARSTELVPGCCRGFGESARGVSADAERPRRANGKRFEEMHVDGGVTAPVLTLPEAFLLRDATFARSREAAALRPDQQQDRTGISGSFPIPPSKSLRGRHRP